MTRLLTRIASAALLLAPAAASAHPVAGRAAGFVHGFAHPFGGLDHLLAMVAVGLLAARLGGRALYLVPLAFVAMMALSGAVAMIGASLPLAEFGIGLSIVVFGAALILDVKMPTAVAMALAGCFAIFHGHVHGTEIPAGVSGLQYAIGFVAASAVLHAAGIALYRCIARGGRSPRIVQAAGAAIALAGMAVLMN